jgi:hypothetical protein
MLAQLGVALGDLALRVRVLPGVVGLGGFFEFTHGRRERDGVEFAGQPFVEVRQQLLLASRLANSSPSAVKFPWTL